jgi:type IV pilus assembly protein PilW
MKYRNVRRSAHPRAKQSGYSLIEVSVAMAVSLFLLAGFFSVLQSTRKASTSQTELAQLQDDERIALTIMSGVIEAGGYYPSPYTNPITTQLPATGSMQVGQVVYGTANPTAALGDTLIVRYNAGANEDVIDCTGNSNSTNNSAASYTNEFRVLQDSTSTPPYLACSVDGGTTFARLVNNVAKMEISYGISSTASVTNTLGVPVDSYVTTADMVNAANANAAVWTNVYSVKVKLTFVNPLYYQPGQKVVTAGQTTKQYLTVTQVVGIMSRMGSDIVSFQ